jgi:hypothetical protein
MWPVKFHFPMFSCLGEERRKFYVLFIYIIYHLFFFLWTTYELFLFWFFIPCCIMLYCIDFSVIFIMITVLRNHVEKSALSQLHLGVYYKSCLIPSFSRSVCNLSHHELLELDISLFYTINYLSSLTLFTLQYSRSITWFCRAFFQH